jgi:hypothetical protein
VAYEKAQLEYDIIARRQAVFSALFDLIIGRENEYREFKISEGVHEIIEYRAAEVHDALIPDSTAREAVEQQLEGFSDNEPVGRATYENFGPGGHLSLPVLS